MQCCVKYWRHCIILGISVLKLWWGLFKYNTIIPKINPSNFAKLYIQKYYNTRQLTSLMPLSDESSHSSVRILQSDAGLVIGEISSNSLARFLLTSLTGNPFYK